jgi:hypothetical protein
VRFQDIDMPSSPTPEAWAQIRHAYENTRRSIEDICLAHGISANTLRRRVKAWGWTMRQPPISDEGPSARMEPDAAEPSAHIAGPPDTRPAHQRLQDAAARVMRAIETTSSRLTAGPVHLRETEMAARTLVSLMRTLRDLNAVLDQHPVKDNNDLPPEDMDEFRNALARRLQAVVERHQAEIPAKYEAAWTEFAAETQHNGRML